MQQNMMFLEQLLGLSGSVWLPVAMLVGLLLALIFRPNTIHNLSLFCAACWLLALSVMVPSMLNLLMTMSAMNSYGGSGFGLQGSAPPFLYACVTRSGTDHARREYSLRFVFADSARHAPPELRRTREASDGIIMFERIDFHQWRCVRTVIDVIEQMPGRWIARGPIVLDDTSVGLLLLWSWLRFESDFLTRCLEELGVDLADLTRQVDGMLKARTIPNDVALAAHWSPGSQPFSNTMRELTAAWMSRATDEARRLRQGYLGMEHFLLAFLRNETSPLAALFFQSGISHRRLKDAILEAIRRRQASKDEPADATVLDPPSTAAWQVVSSRPAVGLPKRFSMAILMSWVTLFAVVFSGLRWTGAPPEVFGVIGILMFLVGIGQMWLFGGTNPCAASIVTGAVVLPVVTFAFNVATGFLFYHPPSNGSERIFGSILYAFLAVPVGAFFGYLSGGLTAGIVLGLNYVEKRKADKENAEPRDTTDEGTPAEQSAMDLTPRSPAD